MDSEDPSHTSTDRLEPHQWQQACRQIDDVIAAKTNASDRARAMKRGTSACRGWLRREPDATEPQRLLNIGENWLKQLPKYLAIDEAIAKHRLFTAKQIFEEVAGATAEPEAARIDAMIGHDPSAFDAELFADGYMAETVDSSQTRGKCHASQEVKTRRESEAWAEGKSERVTVLSAESTAQRITFRYLDRLENTEIVRTFYGNLGQCLKERGEGRGAESASGPHLLAALAEHARRSLNVSSEANCAQLT